MSKFEYIVLEGWEQLSKFVNLYKETAKIKQIKLDIKKKKIGPKSANLNIIGQHGWELISTPIMGAQASVKKMEKIKSYLDLPKNEGAKPLLIFKKKI